MINFKSFGQKLKVYKELVDLGYYLNKQIEHEEVVKVVNDLERVARTAVCPNVILIKDDEQAIENIHDPKTCKWCIERDRLINKYEIDESV